MKRNLWLALALLALILLGCAIDGCGGDRVCEQQQGWRP